MQTLKALTQEAGGITVVMALQQPRPEIFALMDTVRDGCIRLHDVVWCRCRGRETGVGKLPKPHCRRRFLRCAQVILMKSGGALLYNGPPAAVGPFLQAQGYRQDPQVRIRA